MGFLSNSPYNSSTKRSTPNHGTEFLSKSGASLDRERLEVACMRQGIIDEYERKSAELLKYLDSMESAFEHQRSEYEERETSLRRENEELRHELEHGRRIHEAELFVKEQQREEKAQQVVQAVQLLRSEMKAKESIAQKEHKKAMKLQDMMEDLQLTIEKKEEEHEAARRREEKSRKHIEDENDELRRKAALGWMLGCLSELYLRLDREIGTGGIMKLVRKVQRELECGNQVFSTGGVMPPKLEYELIQREIRRLINANAPAQPDLTDKLRASVSMLRTSKAKEFTGELPGDRRKRLRLSKLLRDQEAAALRSVTPAPSSQLPLRGVQEAASACEPFTALREQPRQKHHMACFQDVEKRSGATWAEVRLVEADHQQQAQQQTQATLQAGSKQVTAPSHQIKRILHGLESSMTYLLGQERRRRLHNQRRIL